MTEAIVSAILEKLVNVLVEEVDQEVKLVTGVDDEIKKLQGNFESIRAFLDDAEEKQIKEKSIKLWLDRLKEVLYDMEDVLDEWSTALLKLQIDGGVASHAKGKVCGLLTSCCCFGQVVHRRDIALKIKEINERLDEISKEENRYQLTSRIFNRHIRREESTAFADVSQLHGRDEAKEELVSSLLCGGSDEIESNVRTISIVGMGGMGKTALVQLIFKDRDVETHFDQRIWVCVSEDFDLIGVVKAILGSLDPGSAQNIASHGLQNMLERICQSIGGKKVLLVLDDVWTDESKNWEPLKQAFASAALGSRILVTTRKDTVAEAMGSFRVFHLDELSEEACWEILRQEAFAGKSEEQQKNLEDIGKRIVKKCSGLPLAAKTLGGLLRSKKTRREWVSVLNDEVWKLNLVQRDVFAPLLLSYYDLPSAIRSCFLYCSVFPKDYGVMREEVIPRWMAQGYLNPTMGREMEEVGEEYFECLVARSFFQDVQRNEDGSVSECRMHDMVVDFARFLMGNEFVLKDLNNPEDDRSSSRSLESISWEKARHLLMMMKEQSRVPPRLLTGAEKLRSITIISGGSEDVFISEDLCNLCIQPKHLRSLDFRWGSHDLRWGSLINEFPKEVGKLMHLRLLNLSFFVDLKTLPDSICELANLQSLYLIGCTSLQRLPSKMEKLVNLRCLDTRLCDSLTSYPKGIKRLTSLRKLEGAVVRFDRNDGEEFSLGDLENLCNLRSLFVMRMLGDNIDVNEARRAKLRSKVHLKNLSLRIPQTMDQDDVIRVLDVPSDVNVQIWGGMKDGQPVCCGCVIL